MNTERLRVLVVDDSVAFRTALVHGLAGVASIEVVGEASDGHEAIAMAARLHPDVISMDVIMPHCTGIEAAQKILAGGRMPIVLLSTMARFDEQWMALNALRLGVLDVSNKPNLVGPTAAHELHQLVCVLHNAARATPPASKPMQMRSSGTMARPRTVALIAIGASAGGPAAVERVLGGLHKTPPPVVVAQHLAPNFASTFAKWLADTLGRPVVPVEHTAALEPGCIYIAHDRVNIAVQSGVLRASPTPVEQPVAPSIDQLLFSVAKIYGPRALGMVLTGMGSDGAAGLLAMRARGAYTVAEDQETSVVYGIPRAAAERGACHEVLPLDTLRHVLGEISQWVE